MDSLLELFCDVDDFVKLLCQSGKNNCFLLVIYNDSETGA